MQCSSATRGSIAESFDGEQSGVKKRHVISSVPYHSLCTYPSRSAEYAAGDAATFEARLWALGVRTKRCHVRRLSTEWGSTAPFTL